MLPAAQNIHVTQDWDITGQRVFIRGVLLSNIQDAATTCLAL